MKKYMVITATGPDRPGIVAQITEVLLEYGANVEGSRMTQLGGEFAIIMLASVPADMALGLQQSLTQLERKSLTIATKITHVAPGRFEGYIRYELFASGSADREGMIHSIARFLSGSGINIETLESNVVTDPASETGLFSMRASIRATIQVPPTTYLRGLRQRLAEIGDNLGVDIELKMPYDLVVRTQVFGYNDGTLGSPLMEALVNGEVFGARHGEYGAFGTSADLRSVSFQELADYVEVPVRNRGNFIGALRGLALLGWLKEARSPSGRDEMTQYQLTEQGLVAVDLAKDGVYREVASAAHQLVNLHHYFRPSYFPLSLPTTSGRARALAIYRALIERDRAGWGLPSLEKLTDDDQRVEHRVVDQVRTHLEGSLLSATLLALSRGDYPSFFTRFETVPNVDGTVRRSLNLEQIKDDEYDREFLMAAVELLELHELTKRSGPEKQTLTLTPTGIKYVQLIGSYGVVFAYLKSYAVARELFWGNPDPWGIGEDLHLDRALDIEGSKLAHKPYVEGIHKDLKRLFGELPLDQQGAGIAVIAVGAGELAADSVKYILGETRRGKYLRTHPLDVVAVDLSETSLNEAKETLMKALKNEPWVQVFLVDESYQEDASADAAQVRVILQKGDMNRPDQTDQALCSRGFPRPNAADPHHVLGLNDLVAMLEFGPHDRGVAVNVQTLEQAREVIRKGVRRADRRALMEVLRELGVPQDEIDGAEEEERLLDLVSRQFTVPFSNKGALVPAVVGGADLAKFLEKWATFAGAGLLALELHTPRASDVEEKVPDDPTQLMKYQRSAYAAYQWSHMLAQMMVPYLEHKLAAVLAGLDLRVTQSWPPAGRGTPPPIYMTSYVKAKTQGAGESGE